MGFRGLGLRTWFMCLRFRVQGLGRKGCRVYGLRGFEPPLKILTAYNPADKNPEYYAIKAMLIGICEVWVELHFEGWHETAEYQKR